MEIKVRYLQEAVDFLKEVDTDAKKKILYNVKKVRMGVKDKEIFKKLEGPNILKKPRHYAKIILKTIKKIEI